MGHREDWHPLRRTLPRWGVYNQATYGSPVVKNLPASAGDVSLISGLGRSPGANVHLGVTDAIISSWALRMDTSRLHWPGTTQVWTALVHACSHLHLHLFQYMYNWSSIFADAESRGTEGQPWTWASLNSGIRHGSWKQSPEDTEASVHRSRRRWHSGEMVYRHGREQRSADRKRLSAT